MDLFGLNGSANLILRGRIINPRDQPRHFLLLLLRLGAKCAAVDLGQLTAETEERMKRLVLSAMLVFCFASPSFVSAQALRGDHVEVGVFADYFRMDRTEPNLNYAGLGGRLAFNLRPSVQLEAEMAYDFDRAYNNFDDAPGPIVRSQTHILHAL